jgi:hypothetical protein
MRTSKTRVTAIDGVRADAVVAPGVPAALAVIFAEGDPMPVDPERAAAGEAPAVVPSEEMTATGLEVTMAGTADRDDSIPRGVNPLRKCPRGSPSTSFLMRMASTR